MFLLVPNMQIKCASMLQTPAVLTPLPVFAAVMFSHALGERVGSSVLGAGVVFHDASPKIEEMIGADFYITRQLINKRGACAFYVSKEKNGGDYSSKSQETPTGMSYQPHASMDCELTLVLKLSKAASMQKVKDELLRSKVAGGVVANADKLKPVFFDNFREVMDRVSSGFWVYDAKETVARRRLSGLDPVEAVLGRIDERGWHVPVTVGYSPITDFAHRVGVRLGPAGDPVQHAFSEPVVGLVRLSSVRDVDRERPPLWEHGWSSDNGVEFFLISQS